LENTYKGGIYREVIENPSLNHEISVVGWGTTEDGVEYWVVRNSWGTYWGEYGFFKLAIGTNDNLGVEQECLSGTPTLTRPYLQKEEEIEIIQ